MLVCLTVVAATTINAQSTRRFVIQIPFQFVIAGHTLPAGKYAVERFDPTKPNVEVHSTGQSMPRKVSWE